MHTVDRTQEPALLAATVRPPTHSGRAALAVAVTIVSWASSFPMIRLAVGTLAPMQLAALRLALAAVCLMICVRVIGGSRRVESRDVARFVLCGLVGTALYHALLNTGQRTVSAGAASFLVNTVPVITALMAAAWLRERLGMIGWAGNLLSFGGVAVIASGQPGGLAFGAGASLVVTAAIAQATLFVLQRPLVVRYGALSTAAYTLAIGALLLVPWLPGAWGALAAAPEPAFVILLVVALAVVSTAIGNVSWAFALDHFGASRASSFLYLVPPVTTLLAIPMAGEIPTATTLVGGVAIVAGVALVNLRKRAPNGPA